MYKTCKSCGTIFDLDESILSNNIHWLKCSVCNEKWSLTDNESKTLDKNIVNEEGKATSIENKHINETEKVKNELASIKSVVEDQTKRMSKQNNPILEIKNKSVAEISSELSASKLKFENRNQENKADKLNKKNKDLKNKISFFPFILLLLTLFFSVILFFRSTFFAYSFFYFPKHTEKYVVKINDIFNAIQLPILAELGHIKMIDFVATVQQNKIKFAGVIKNNSSRLILAPRIRVLVIREDRKILMEQIIVLNDRIIKPSAVIEFQQFAKVKFKEENINVKATILKRMFSN